MPTFVTLLTLDEIALWVKQAILNYMLWSQTGDIRAHRPCPTEGCGCLFRHRNGWAPPRSVICGRQIHTIRLLQLFCPACGQTEVLSPTWLRRGSPYPWPWQEAAALRYVSGPAGYRPVAAEFGVDYTVVWGWLRPLAAVAVALVRVTVREQLRQDPGAHLDLTPVVFGGMLLKARTVEKRLGLEHLPLLSTAAAALRAACLRPVDLPPGGTEPKGALGWLSRYLPLHGAPAGLWIGSHRRSHSLTAAAPA